MYKRIAQLLLLLALGLYACKANKTGQSYDSKISIKEDLNQKNRANIPLIEQIRRLPGVAVKYGVPYFVKSANSFSTNSNIEPLYILDDFIVGNSFKSVSQLITNINIEKITVLSDTEAAFYGSRASNGVIVITSKK